MTNLNTVLSYKNLEDSWNKNSKLKLCYKARLSFINTKLNREYEKKE